VPDERERAAPSTPEHRYNDPTLTTKEFLHAVMHDTTLPLGTRMDAATKLLPLEVEVPTYYGEFPWSRRVDVTIRIAPIDGGESPGAPEVHVGHVGFGPRDEAVP
jgi:hypothetical protein